ncbi:MAG: hypothetical protein ACR2RV_21175 [Verrucomicrobiales bacterium]
MNGRQLAIGIVIACISCYLLGRFLRLPSDYPEISDAPASSATLTALSLGERSQRMRQLIDSSPTPDRMIEIQTTVLGMGAQELAKLWDSRHASLNYYEDDDRKIAAAILGRLGELDPQLALSKIGDTNTGKYKLLPSVLQGWARSDLDGALGWIREQDDHRARTSCMSAVLDLVGREDRAAAVDLFLTAVGERTIAPNNWDAETFFRRWSGEEREAALVAALEINAATGSRHAVWGVIDAWSKTDPGATADWIESRPPGRLRSVAYDRLMKTWARHDPESAAGFVLAVHASGEPGPGFSRVLREWVASDFTAAASWVDAVSDPDLRETLRAELIGQSDYTSDRRETLEFALSHLAEDPDLLGSVIDDAWSVANKDPAAAREWAAENLTDTAQLAKFNDSILSSWIDGDPEAATTRLEEFGAGESHYRQAARNWAQRDLAASRAWLEDLAPGAMRDAATVGLAEGWLRENREAAGDWIESFPTGELRDQLTDSRARATMNVKDIQASIEIASEIREPFLRDQTYEDILKTWIRDEAKAEAAREFTENTDLISETVRWRVLNRPWGHP